ncbi:MAG: aldolase [Gemmataceae bacterium]
MAANERSLREEICEIGRRLYQRGFAAANDGNISARLGPKEVLCTPTMICKGFMKPEDLCVVDYDGNQVRGQRKRTSEILLHLAIYKARPDVMAVVHCHPPHATAFAVAHEPIPKCVLPEVEVFLGEVPIARYETPGTQAFAETVLPFVAHCNTVILANHGTVSFGPDVEKAYWYTEILDAYCRILVLARQLGRVNTFSGDKTRELLELKKRLGLDDPRFGLEDCDLCANNILYRGYREFLPEPQAFAEPPTCASRTQAPPGAQTDRNVAPGASALDGAARQADRDALEELVHRITDQVLSALETA